MLLFVTVYFHPPSRSFRFHSEMVVEKEWTAFKTKSQQIHLICQERVREKKIMFNVTKSTGRNIFGFDFIHLFAVAQKIGGSPFAFL